MSDVSMSPSDPIFFTLHAFMDKVWEDWRQKKQVLTKRATEYTETCSEYDKLDSPLQPFDLGGTVLVKDGLSNKYTDEFYSYNPSPTCTQENPSCQDSPYLYCDVEKSRCMSKIRPNGNCQGFDGKEICYKGNCVDGQCVSIPEEVAESK